MIGIFCLRRNIIFGFFVMIYVSMMAEILDFQPIWHLLDAHALWHASTVPLTVAWYQFVCADVLWDDEIGVKSL